MNQIAIQESKALAISDWTKGLIMVIMRSALTSKVTEDRACLLVMNPA